MVKLFWSTRPTTVPAGSDHYFHTECPPVHTYVPKLQNKATITAGRDSGLAEWIIDDSCLVFHYIPYFKNFFSMNKWTDKSTWCWHINFWLKFLILNWHLLISLMCLILSVWEISWKSVMYFVWKYFKNGTCHGKCEISSHKSHQSMSTFYLNVVLQILRILIESNRH